MLCLDNVSKRFVSGENVVTAIEGVSLDVAAGEFVTLVGPSGCGKSTILNIVSGLMPPTEGTVSVNGSLLRGVTRDVGYVTQQPNLMPWRTLIENVSFPLEIKQVSRAERLGRARELIKLIGLEGFEDAFPEQLSGGMRQRANIIRTLIYEPSVILMDEPFGPLDAQPRLSLLALVLSIWETQRSTVLFVTHDLTEAIALADRVVLMSARPGRIVRTDRVDIPRARDIFHLHDLPEFRRLYDALWNELAAQLDGFGRSTH